MTQSRPIQIISSAVLFSAVFVGTWLLSARADTQPITLLPGIYRVTGTAPVQPGEPAYTYTGAAEILASLEHPGIYDVRWVMDARPESNAAIGQGYEHNGVFVVIIASADGAFTLASYAREGDTLTGVWMIPGETGLLTETLTRTTKATLQEALEPVVPGPARPEHAPSPRVNPAETYTI